MNDVYKKYEKELLNLSRKEREDYEKRRIEFYSDPAHWSNNKRRMHGLCSLRGNTNKYRSKKYNSFRASAVLFRLIEDTIDDVFTDMLNDAYFNKFVNVKDFYGDNFYGKR